jgi:hypothetical protein
MIILECLIVKFKSMMKLVQNARKRASPVQNAFRRSKWRFACPGEHVSVPGHHVS